MSEQPVDSAPEAQSDSSNEPEPFDPERAQAKIKKANDEARALRQRLKELEPVAQEAERLRQAQMSEQERQAAELAQERQAREQAQSELVRLRVALRYGIGDDDLDLLGSGSEEQIEERAQKVAAKNAAAAGAVPAVTSRRPTEVLRGGASPTPPALNDDSRLLASLNQALGVR